MQESLENVADADGPVGAGVVAACALASVPGMGAASLGRVARRFGTLLEAMQAGASALLSHADELDLRARTREFLSGNPDLAALGSWAVEAARQVGAWILVVGDPRYPALLLQIENPPPVLYLRGSLASDAKRVALVGARAADEQSLALARKLGGELAMAGVQVVSGGARGVDAAAHAGALWGQGTTVAVLGCGIDVPYPQENEELFDRLASGGGAVVSEFPPGTPASKSNFPRRNRTIAGLSHATVVVRATEASGALITADRAAAQGRPIFAVPGKAGEELSAGPNKLLALGAARAVTCAQEVLEALGWPVPPQLQVDDASRPTTPSGKVQPERWAVPALDERVLDEPSLMLWRLLDDRRPVHVDDLAERSQLPAHEALRKLTELELKGLCVQRPGKYFLRR